ncbi:hypothetical protein O181_076109 [Austropuccinia psidii MF-1]|uniref:F-box domain-containing protein n=1 Tax=Austropuccinia psidii MF-1 TaxID=1389203 RepID=A0A9Q3IF39_9BASI|nr:hypothetical protein [Austropuccinia psidii MF-1]
MPKLDACFPYQLGNLSEELLLEILSYLTIHDLSIVSRLSLKFKRLADEPQLWRRIYRSLFVEARLKYPFLPGFDQRLCMDREACTSHDPCDRKGKGKQTAIQEEFKLGHSWKKLCRISLNWQTGSARLTCVTPINHSPSHPSSSCGNRSQAAASSRSNTIVRFYRSLLFIAHKSRLPAELPTVHVYHLRNSPHNKNQNSDLIGRLVPPQSHDRQAFGVGVSEISIDEGCETTDSVGISFLVTVFYTTARLTVFRINLPSLSMSYYPTELEFHPVGSFQLDLQPKPTDSSKPLFHTLAETAKFHFPLIVTCSTDFCLRFFRLSWLSVPSKDRLQITQLSLEMQNNSCYWPLSLSLSPQVSSNRFKMRIAYPMPFYPSTWTIGLQEFDIELALPSSASSLQIHANHFLTAFEPIQDKYRKPVLKKSEGLGGIVVGIEQAAENVIVGRADNTIDCFRLSSVSEDSNSRFKRQLTCFNRLFGHTAKIGSISVDESGRCISGAMDGVKVWEGSKSVDVIPEETHNNQKIEARKIIWIGSDCEKIVSLWVREDEKDGKPSIISEEVRVLSFI